MGLAAEMAGKMSISGVQEKLSLRLSDGKSRFEIAPAGGQYILKREPSRFAFLPQNEHLTMRLKVLLLNWWVSNGDQHLKNFSLLRTTEGRWRLAPAHDRVCTRLPVPSGLGSADLRKDERA